MKRGLAILLVGMLFAVGCSNGTRKVQGNNISVQQNTIAPNTPLEDGKYKDGVYEVQSQPDYEGYYSTAKVTIKDNKIDSVDWKIIDSERKRDFDEKYEEVFAGNKEYQEQCRNDLKGAKTYSPKLVETQEISEVDAISGATWSNKKFKEVVRIALEKAKK
ncbi:MAG: FMN-binding protein [Clostridia bacterium]|nr:FMN-binding protein [Clostridia bacterium]